MEIEILLQGGELSGQVAYTDGLDDLKVFFFPATRQVEAYMRVNEVEYHFDKKLSDAITARYDEAVFFFAGEPLSSIRFAEPTGGE